MKMAKNSQQHQKTKFEPIYFQNVRIIFRIESHDHQDECDREPPIVYLSRLIVLEKDSNSTNYRHTSNVGLIIEVHYYRKTFYIYIYLFLEGKCISEIEFIDQFFEINL